MKAWHAILIVVFCGVSFLIGRKTVSVEYVESVDVDTIHDTTFVFEPILLEMPQPLEVVEVPFSIVDTRIDTVTNTIFVPVQIEQSVFRGQSYTAWVSGPRINDYRPRLDSLYIYQENTHTVRTVKEKPQRFGLGVMVGYGLTSSGRLEPTISVGAYYRIW